ncbi:MAG: hypothetical protein J6Y10_03745 [Lachnospiraceae bacterium]|nr:hypothetical protein [Lachnospiraceae bacterium]
MKRYWKKITAICLGMLFSMAMIIGMLSVMERNAKDAAGKQRLQIVSATDDWDYDGQKHTKKKYTVTYGENTDEGYEGQTEFTLPTGDRVRIVPDDSAAVTHVWDGPKENSFTWSLENEVDYDVTTSFGSLSISPASLTIKMEDRTIDYSGELLYGWSRSDTDKELFYGLAPGDIGKINYTPSSGREVGVYENGQYNNSSFSVCNLDSINVTQDYKLTTKAGKLNIVDPAVSVMGNEYIIDMSKALFDEVIDASTGNGKSVVVTGKTRQYSVIITAAENETVTVVFRDLGIDVTAIDKDGNPSQSDTCGKPAVLTSGDGAVVIQLEGSNIVASGKGCAGVQKENKEVLTITSEDLSGTLQAIGGGSFEQENPHCHFGGGAGIGGGGGRHGFGITIIGGTVIAESESDGAGIGSGGGTYEENCDGYDITITGGNVTARGGNNGAGIGGGSQGSGFNIKISGGTVLAEAGSDAAGIGGGYYGSGHDISITSGTVIAKAKMGGAGIGGGFYSDGADICISGGTVTAIATYEGAGIGGGVNGEATNIKIQNDAVVMVSGGAEKNWLMGGGIGSGGENSNPGSEIPIDEIIDETFTGDIIYYVAGTTVEEIEEGNAQRVNCATITFDANSGEGTMEPVVVTLNLPKVLPENLYAKTGHSFVEWTTEENGSGDSFKDKAKAAFSADTTLHVQWSEHVYEDIVDAGCLVTGPSCTQGSVYYKSCKCGEKSTETFGFDDALGHKFDKEDANKDTLKTEATCTEAAVYYKSCSVCGEKSTEEKDVFSYGEALDHDYKAVDGSAVAPTCTKAGKEADQKCSRCNAVITGKEISASGHSFDQELADAKYLKTAATCTKPAVYYKSCSACGEKGTETFESGSPLDHDYQEVANTAKEATCTDNGKETDRKCILCGDTITGKTITAKGHVWKAATGDAPKTCEICGITEGDVISYIPVGGDTIEWESGDITLTFKRSEQDELCFGNYRETQIDKNPVKVSAKAGSTVITIDEATLKALSAGEHTITVVFADALSEVKLVIKEPVEEEPEPSPTPIPIPDAPQAPKTGDGFPVLPIAVVMLFAIAGAAGVTAYRKKAQAN